MRHALVSLFAASAATAIPVSALAQETTPDMTPPEAAVGAPPPTVEPATSAMPAAPPTSGGPAPAVGQATQPAAPATPAQPAAPTTAQVSIQPVDTPAAPPPPPTDPVTIRALHLVENLCKPMVTGGDFEAIAKPLGFRKKRDAWVLTGQKPTTFTITPSAANPNVCRLEINHPIGGDQALTVGLHNWAIGRGWTLYRNDEFTTDLKRHTRSWELVKDGKSEALVMVTARKPDGSPLERRADHTTIMYSVQ